MLPLQGHWFNSWRGGAPHASQCSKKTQCLNGNTVKSQISLPSKWVTNCPSLPWIEGLWGHGVSLLKLGQFSANWDSWSPYQLPSSLLGGNTVSSILGSLQKHSVQLLSRDSLRPHGLEHARPPCPSPTPRVYPNSHPLSWWCHPTISSSVIPFSSCPQSLPASESSPMSQFFARGGQSTGVSASASFLPMNTQDWSPLGWTGWISLQSKGLSKVFSNTTVQKHQFFGSQLSL